MAHGKKLEGKATVFTLTCGACGACGGFEYFKFDVSKGEGKYEKGIAEIYASESECELCGSHKNVRVTCKVCKAAQVLEEN